LNQGDYKIHRQGRPSGRGGWKLEKNKHEAITRAKKKRKERSMRGVEDEQRWILRCTA